MAQIGFLYLINNTFIYLAFSFISFVTVLIISGGKPIISLLVAPFPYFVWQLLSHVSERSVSFVQKLGPANYLKGRQGCLQNGVGCVVFLVHFVLWVIPYVAVVMIATVIRFVLDLPLRAISELSFAPMVRQIYVLSSKAVANEKKWHLKRNALIGSLFVFFGFTYQFVGMLMVIKW